jgi:serine/threonine protein kinase
MSPIDGSPPFDAAPRVGDVLRGRWQVLGELGRGAHGVVLRALDTEMGEVVAIKLLGGGGAASPEALPRFLRELRLARKILHPSVVRIHELFELPQGPAFSMELVEGETLRARLDRTPRLPAAELARLAEDVAGGLAAAHRVGVIHRDLKPANLLLEAATGRALIADFGVSTQERSRPVGEPGAEARHLDITRTGAVLGTPAYMAPEQFDGQATPAVDVYALGVVLYEAATGARPPRRDRTDAPPPAPLGRTRPDLPAGLALLVDRCLARAPARFRDGGELLAALRALRTTRRRTWSTVVATLFAALAAVGVVAWWRAGQLLDSEQRVTIRVSRASASGPRDLDRALQRLAARRLRQADDEFSVVDESAAADLELQLVYQIDDERLVLRAELANPAGQVARRVEVAAPSVAEAVDQVAAQLVPALGAGRSARPAQPVELLAMRRLGARTAPALRAYRRAIDCAFAASLVESERCLALAEEAIHRDPGWQHARVLHAELRAPAPSELGAEPEPRSAADAAVRTGFLLLRAGALDEAIRLLQPRFEEDPDDVLVGALLERAYGVARQSDERLALARRLHERRPDLRFGDTVAQYLRAAGRADEAEALERAWVDAAPESQQAWLTRQRPQLAQGHAGAEGALAEARFLFGRSAPLELAVCDLLLASGRTVEAAALLAALPDGDAVDRVRARQRAGLVALEEGRLDEARADLEEVSFAWRTQGDQAMLPGLFTALHGLAVATRRADDHRRTLLEERAYLVASGRTAEAFAVDLELGPKAPPPCAPALELGALVDDPPRARYLWARCALERGQRPLVERAFAALAAAGLGRESPLDVRALGLDHERGRGQLDLLDERRAFAP